MNGWDTKEVKALGEERLNLMRRMLIIGLCLISMVQSSHKKLI